MSMMELLAQSPGLQLTVAALLGLLIGSFLNVVIHRLPLMMQRDWRSQCLEYLELRPEQIELPDPVPEHKVFNLIRPASRCPACEAPVRAWQNIPVLSYLLLRGRCAGCGQGIALRYPLIEISAALLAALVTWQFGLSLESAPLLIFSWTLLALSVIDLDHQLLPDDITLPLLWLGLLVNIAGFGLAVSATDAVIGAAAGYLLLWSVYWLFRLLTGREGMGFGDFKLLAAIGAWLGWQALPLVVILSSLIGTVIGLSVILATGRDRNAPLPFGPYLALAGLIGLLWGEQLIHSYYGLMGVPAL